MQIRPAIPPDLDRLVDLDGTIESLEYLHLERGGEGLAARWALEPRPLREKKIDPNVVDEDARFALKQTLTGVEEGIVLVAEHDDQLVGLALAQPDPVAKTLRIADLRVDYDLRREGLGSAMLFQLIAHARQIEARAVAARTLTDNVPAARFLAKAGFELAGVDTHFRTNHDLVKESVALFWYAALD
jgi:RimJ/RimL family protein N-acetyltransferase